MRGFVLTGRGSQSTADSKAILTLYWGTIISIGNSNVDGPSMQAVTSSGLREIDLS